jgi:peptide deformylase
MEKIVTIQAKEDERFLRTKTVAFDFAKHSRADIRALVKRMREAMNRANGVGLSANQIGLRWRVFVAQVPAEKGGKPMFYAIFNPRLSKQSPETETLEEGCLSVPETWGPTERHYRLVLDGQDASGKPVKIKAWGLLARIFQHECDHLDGKLFVDKAEKLYTVAREDSKK